MASFLPRRRSLLFKFLVAIPAVWFCVIFVMAYQDKWSSSDGKNDKLVERNENHENHNDKEVILIKPPPDDENLKNIKNMNIEKNNEHLKNDVDDYEHRNPHAGGHEDPPKHDHVEDKVRKERKDRGQAEKPEAFVIDPNAPGILFRVKTGTVILELSFVVRVILACCLARVICIMLHNKEIAVLNIR